MKTSPNPTDESSSRLFTSLLIVLGSKSWRPPWGMGKYLRGRLNWSPFCCHSTDESSLDRRVVTQPTSRHSTDESSLDRFVVTRPFMSSLAVARLDLRSRSTRSAQSLGSISRSRSTRSAQSLGSISRGHSLVLFTRPRSISRSRSDPSLLVELTCRFSNKDSLRRIHI
ncbi:hypothetical protein F2Q70_00044255 [Brassica cretica]|uniref:Uncharacterized protein n=1 Tax=Brassica cretica TaxID=69181 RepID=A0A8S9KJ91_BRACR|nr:hypothetical protein F2Q70_00044255 [Brassica cretica]